MDAWDQWSPCCPYRDFFNPRAFIIPGMTGRFLYQEEELVAVLMDATGDIVVIDVGECRCSNLPDPPDEGPQHGVLALGDGRELVEV